MKKPSSSQSATEAQFDGLVGPTHHYAGLSHGNVASTLNAGKPANPKMAALQGIKKASFLRSLGVDQGVLPPIRRPKLEILYNLGFRGSDSEMLELASQKMPEVLSHCFSASSMWTANAGTVSPSSDTLDGKTHFTPANLSSKFHRSLEKTATGLHLRSIFKGDHFSHHDPIDPFFGDEGAANHGRLCGQHGEAGLEIFVFGKSAVTPEKFKLPVRFPARQSLEASQAVSSLHQLQSSIFVQQNPDVIDQGVFHNDVISVINENVFFTHEMAFVDQKNTRKNIEQLWKGSKPLEWVEVQSTEVSVQDAVSSYLFNSQLVSLPSGEMALICPEECQRTKPVWDQIQKIISGPSRIKKVFPFDLHQSMQNGGGPACLRLRVVLTDAEKAQVHSRVWLTDKLEADLQSWIVKHYRDRLAFQDLRDPKFLIEVNETFDGLEKILGFPIA